MRYSYSMDHTYQLTENEIGVSAYLKDYDEFTEGEDWWFGKTGHIEYAKKLVNGVWDEENTKELLKRLPKKKELIFITVPSSSGINMIPEVLARQLARDLGGRALNGRDYYSLVVDRQMKSVPKNERIFLERIYKPKKVINFLRNCEIVVVDDLILTGTSVYAFIRSLQRDGIMVETVACLFGNPDLTPTQKSLNRLCNIFSENNIYIPNELLYNFFVEGEILNIIEQYNLISSKGKKYEFTRRVYGILDSRFVGFMGQSPCSDDKWIRERESWRNEPISRRIQIMSNLMAIGGRRVLYLQEACQDAYRESEIFPQDEDEGESPRP